MPDKLVIGIDIGGTETKGVLLHPSSPRLLASTTQRTPRDRQRLLNVVADLYRALRQNRQIVGVGLSIAGVVDASAGSIVVAHNLRFLSGWRIASAAQRRLGVPVRLENDARCFLLAESTHGAARGKGEAVGVVIGTGIGGAFTISGRVQTGAHGSAGEFGYMTLSFGRKRASWEQLGGFKAYRKYGDRSVIVGMGVANLINALDPEIVVLGGGGVYSGAIEFPMVRKVARRLVVLPAARRTPIVRSHLGRFASAIGAAFLVR